MAVAAEHGTTEPQPKNSRVAQSGISWKHFSSKTFLRTFWRLHREWKTKCSLISSDSLKTVVHKNPKHYMHTPLQEERLSLLPLSLFSFKYWLDPSLLLTTLRTFGIWWFFCCTLKNLSSRLLLNPGEKNRKRSSVLSISHSTLTLALQAADKCHLV